MTMSAYFVEDATIDAAVTLLDRAGRLRGNPTQVGRAMLAMNLDAMLQRYPSIRGTDEARDYAQRARSYNYKPRPEGQPTLCKSLECLLYQCAEGDVPETEMFKALDADLVALRPAKGRWPTPEWMEYQRAPWGLTDWVAD
jgi:hypothetical protein